MPALIVLIVILCISFAAQAQEVVRSITVRGVAEQAMTPDKATISATLYSEGRKLEEVKAAHDEKLRTLYALAGELKIERKDLKTEYANISPKYRYQEGKQIFDGYQASTGVAISLREIGSVADVMDRMVSSGIDRIQGVTYGLADMDAKREALLRDALLNARQKATSLAEALGQSIGKPISIAEGGVSMPEPPQPIMARSMMKAEAMAADAAPVAPPEGETMLRAEVTASFELQ